MADKIFIELTSSEGLTVNTKGAYCDKDIAVIPKLEELRVKPTTEEQVLTALGGYVGIGTVIVEAEDVTLKTKEITTNGTYTASDDNVDGFSSVVVEVPLITKSVTENGTYKATDDGADGYSEFTVNVAGGGLPTYDGTTKRVIKAGTYKFNDVLTYDVDKINDYWFLHPFEVNALLSMGGQSVRAVLTCGYQFTADGNGNVSLQYYISQTSPDLTSAGFSPGWYTVYQDGVWANQFYANVEDTKSITFLNDIEIDGIETNYQFIIANTNYNEVNAQTKTITYNGQIIASLNAGETAKLSCKDTRMLTDLIIQF